MGKTGILLGIILENGNLEFFWNFFGIGIWNRNLKFYFWFSRENYFFKLELEIILEVEKNIILQFFSEWNFGVGKKWDGFFCFYLFKKN